MSTQQVYGIGGMVAVGPPVLTGFGAPLNANPAQLGQLYYDKSTSPFTAYIWSGQSWVLDANAAGSFTTLAVSGVSSLADVNAEDIVATGLVTANSGFATTPVIVTAGASPRVCNARHGQVTFSGVSIAAAATQTLVITNSMVTGSATVVLYSMVGGTTGGALSIQSVTNSAGSSSIVVANGTGATTSTANLTFVFWVMG